MTAEDLAILREIVTMAVGAMGTSLSQILEGHQVALTVEKEELGTPSRIVAQYPSGYVVIAMTLSGSFSGVMSLFLAQADATNLAHAAMGLGEEVSAEFGDFEKEVLGQAFQTAGEALVTTLADFSGRSLHLDSVQILEEEAGGEGAIFSGTFAFDELLRSLFHFYIPAALAETMAGILGGADLRVEEPQLARETSEVAIERGAEAKQEREVKPRGDGEKKGVVTGVAEEKTVAQPVQFTAFEKEVVPEKATVPNLDLVLDVPMEITVELGRAKKSIREILELGTGSIVELDKLEGDPVDILANGKLFAKGEVVVIGETFGVRVVEIISSHLRHVAD